MKCHTPALLAIAVIGDVMSRLLRRKAASDYLNDKFGLPRAPSTLAKLAVLGGGPIFRRAGRIPLYEPADLDTWAASKLSGPLRSTSDLLQSSGSPTANVEGENRVGKANDGEEQ